MTDLIILGGGLAGGLCALALAQRRPELTVRLVERDDSLGGNHLWSFFGADIAPGDRSLVDRLVVQRWACNAVLFPARRRTFDEPYHSISSGRFDEVLKEALPENAIVRGDVVEAGPRHAVLASGERIEARALLDVRGLSEPPKGLDCGWQKFVGQMLDIPGGHGLGVPMIMDATVDQADGYRFVYCLPFDEKRVFVEDTYYSDTADLDRDALAARIADYAAREGWRDPQVVHEEQGVLPVVKRGDFDRFWPADDTVARAGVRGGFFHPLTSYSLTDAVRFASWLAAAMPMDGDALAAATRTRGLARWKRGRFDRLLARMLFDAADPLHRYRVLERFYGLETGLIARFYAGRSTLGDRLRILAGRPPVSIARAIRVLAE